MDTSTEFISSKIFFIVSILFSLCVIGLHITKLSLQFCIASAGVFTLCWSSQIIFFNLIQGVIVINSSQNISFIILDSCAEQTTQSNHHFFAILANFKTVSLEFQP